MTKAVFIVGNKRSGSTQLMELLNLHPSIFVSNESDILWILQQYHNDLDFVRYPWDTDIGMNKTLEQCGHLLTKDKTPFENFVNIQTSLMKEGFIRMKPMNKDNLLWIGDQKPFRQIDPEHMPFIKDNFPGAKFIHLIRHPFPVVRSSQVFVGDLWKGMSADKILQRWTLHEQWVQQAKEENEVPILDIRYEDIITQPETEMARMFDFLEVPYDETTLQQARKITRSTIKLYPRLNCPPETQTIMAKYGYRTKSFS